MPHQPVPNQGSLARHPGPAPPDGAEATSEDVAEHGGYAVNALNARAMQNAWAAGVLGPTST